MIKAIFATVALLLCAMKISIAQNYQITDFDLDGQIIANGNTQDHLSTNELFIYEGNIITVHASTVLQEYYWALRIDLNQDGHFSAGERIYISPEIVSGNIDYEITLNGEMHEAILNTNGNFMAQLIVSERYENLLSTNREPEETGSITFYKGGPIKVRTSNSIAAGKDLKCVDPYITFAKIFIDNNSTVNPITIDDVKFISISEGASGEENSYVGSFGITTITAGDIIDYNLEFASKWYPMYAIDETIGININVYYTTITGATGILSPTLKWVVRNNCGNANRLTEQQDLLDADINLHVFPNPVKDHFQVDFGLESNAIVSAALYNNLGQMVEGFSAFQLEKGNRRLNIPSHQLEQGIYYFELTVNGVKHTRKIIK